VVKMDCFSKGERRVIWFSPCSPSLPLRPLRFQTEPELEEPTLTLILEIGVRMIGCHAI